MFRRAVAFGATLLVAVAVGLLNPRDSLAGPHPGALPSAGHAGGMHAGGAHTGIVHNFTVSPSVRPLLGNCLIPSNSPFCRVNPGASFFNGVTSYCGPYNSKYGYYPYYPYQAPVNVSGYTINVSGYTPVPGPYLSSSREDPLAFLYLNGLLGRDYDEPPPVNPKVTPAKFDAPAHVTMNVPADAEVWFGETKMRATGAVREYQTPTLLAGRYYSYDVTARWTANGREVVQRQVVSVGPDVRVTVNFPVPLNAPEMPPPPKGR